MHPMSIKELGEILLYISQNNSPLRDNVDHRPSIKYVDPVIDMRNNTVFCIKLRGICVEEIFYSSNEYRYHPMTLKQRLIAFLDSGYVTPPAIAAAPRIAINHSEREDSRSCMNCDHRMMDFKSAPCNTCEGDSNWKKFNYSILPKDK